MSSVVPGPGGMKWTIGECGCGRTTWSVRGGDGLGVLMVAECGCGERRELRLSAGPSVASPEPVTFTFAEFGSPLLERVKLGPWRREVVARSPEGMKLGPSVIDRTFEWWMEQTRDLAAEHKAQAARDIAALDPRCPTKTVAEVAAERGHALPGGLRVNAPPEGWVAPVMGSGRLVEVEVDWGPPLRRRVTVMDDGDDVACDFEVEHFDERVAPLGSQVEVRRGWDGVQRVSLQKREAHPQSAVGLLLAMPGVVEAEVRADRHTGAWHITYRGGPSPTVIRQALREAFPKQPFTVGRQGDEPARPILTDEALEHMRKKSAEVWRDRSEASGIGLLVPVYLTDAGCIDVEPQEPGQQPCGHVVGMPAPGSVARMLVGSRGDVWLMKVASVASDRPSYDTCKRAMLQSIAAGASLNHDALASATPYFAKCDELLDMLKASAERNRFACERVATLAASGDWAALEMLGERGTDEERQWARGVVLGARKIHDRLPDIRDDWDNLPDAEPEGIVPRGAK